MERGNRHMAFDESVPVGNIVVGERRRRDLGDIDGLAASIAESALLHPLVVTPDYRLVAGERRLKAVQKLGRTTVAVHVVATQAEALQALMAELAENTCRKDFTPSEAVAVGETLERLERPKAAARQQATQAKPGEGKVGGGKLPPPEGGKTRDRVARAVGMSGQTFVRAKAVVEAARDDPEKYGPIKEQMEKTGKVNGAYRRLAVLKQAEAIAAEPPPLPEGPFRVLVADPPWHYEKRPDDPGHRSALPYPSMTPDDIKALPISRLAAPDALLWLWTTNAHMPLAFELLRAWGFDYKTALTWVKPSMGCGDWLRGQTEHCLLAVRGRPTVTLTNQTTALHAPAREHSRKPEEFYRLVEALCPGSKVELFARCERPGWASYGDQVGLFGRTGEQHVPMSDLTDTAGPTA
jgi:N6-adenosine-specific RNA methylase IME4